MTKLKCIVGLHCRHYMELCPIEVYGSRVSHYRCCWCERKKGCSRCRQYAKQTREDQREMARRHGKYQ